MDLSDTRHARARALIDREPGLAPGDGPTSVVVLLRRVCWAVAHHLDVDGAAVNLMSSGGSQGVAGATDLRSRALVELEFSTGEGPCHAAFAARRPVLVPDLTASTAYWWPAYTAGALETGIGAVFAFPLNVGAAGLGVLDLFADAAGALDDEQMAMALAFADIATTILLDGRLITSTGDLEPDLARALDHRAEIHQAQGMLKVILKVDLAEALARLRAYAFTTERPLIDVAREIVADRTFAENEI